MYKTPLCRNVRKVNVIQSLSKSKSNLATIVLGVQMGAQNQNEL